MKLLTELCHLVSAVQVLSPDSVVKKIKEKLLVNYKKIPCLK